MTLSSLVLIALNPLKTILDLEQVETLGLDEEFDEFFLLRLRRSLFENNSFVRMGVRCGEHVSS